MISRAAIGLEVHAQLLTTQKLFSPSPNLSSSPPNTLISPFDLALPGSLPVLNLACVEKALVAASVLKCSINDTSQFERKVGTLPPNLLPYPSPAPLTPTNPPHHSTTSTQTIPQATKSPRIGGPLRPRAFSPLERTRKLESIEYN